MQGQEGFTAPAVCTEYLARLAKLFQHKLARVFEALGKILGEVVVPDHTFFN